MLVTNPWVCRDVMTPILEVGGEILFMHSNESERDVDDFSLAVTD